MAKAPEEVLRTIGGDLEALRRFGVKRLGLFGSAARGEAGAASDLDFIVEFESVSFDAYMDLKEYLEALFGRRVDLVRPDTIKPRLRPRILAEAIDVPGL